VLHYDELIKHEEKCLYQNRACTGCGKVSIVKEIVEHENVCDRVFVICNGCKLSVKREELVVHEKDRVVCIEAKMENMRRMYEKEMFAVKSENQTLKVALEEQGAEVARLKTQLGNNGQESIKNAFSGVAKPMCDKGHELKYYPPDKRSYSAWDFVCNKCKALSGKSSFHCPQCKYDLCDRCFAFPFRKDKCMHNHDLVKTNNRHHICDRCFKNQVGVSYYCKFCAFDLCESCQNLL